MVKTQLWERFSGFCWVLMGFLLAACGEQPPDTESPGAAESLATSTSTRKAESLIWLQGSSLSGPNGLYVSPDHKLYIASALDSTIRIMNPDTGAIEGVLGEKAGVFSPDDLAFDRTGRFCWTAILTGEVGCISPGAEKVTAAQLSPGVNPITFSDDGRLFVSQCFFGDKTYEVDPAGAEPARLITDQLGPRCGLNGMDIGPDGKLYGPRWFRGEIARLDVDSGAVETAARGFHTPAAVKFDGEGRLHVVDSATGEVVRLANNGEHEVLATLTPGLDNLAFDDHDRLFVSRSPDNDIIEVSADGTTRSVNPAGLSVPGGITFVAGKGQSSIVVTGFYALRYLDPATGRQQKIVRDVFSVSDLGSVLTVHGGAEELILSSWMDGAIRSWNPTTDTLNHLYAGVGQPIDALRYQGEIVYSDWSTGSVRQLRSPPTASTPHTEQSEQPGETGETEGAKNVGFSLYQSDGGVAGLAVDETQNLYLTEHFSGRFLLLARDGEWLDSPQLITDRLNGPEGVYVTQGKAYVIQAGNQSLAEIDIGTGKITERVSGLALGRSAIGDLPPTMIFSGVTGDAEGNLYFGGETGNVLYRLKR